MPYTIRNANGEITALLRDPAIGAEEFLPQAHPEIEAFLSNCSREDPKLALADSDKDIARITEDLIHLLTAKNLILFTELPTAVQQKLLNRERLRSSLQGAIDNFLDEDESI
ncbi:MAG: hypothetical protein CL693_00495 [Cellvibrionaceae bacterium]|nr:hypothetical protein [Cellvibrionaceae bacterium]